MSERTLKEKPAAKRRTEEAGTTESRSLRERGEELKAKLDEVDDLIQEALADNADDVDLDERIVLTYEGDELEDVVLDGERCPCGHPLDECVMSVWNGLSGDRS